MTENKQPEQNNEEEKESFNLRGNADEHNFEYRFGGEKLLKHMLIALIVIGVLLLFEIGYFAYKSFIGLFEDDTKTEQTSSAGKPSNQTAARTSADEKRNVIPKAQQLNPDAKISEFSNDDHIFRTYVVTAPKKLRTENFVLSLANIEKQNEDGFTIIEEDEEYVYPTLKVKNVSDQSVQVDSNKWLMYDFTQEKFIYQADFDSYRYNIIRNPVIPKGTNAKYKFMFIGKQNATLAMCYNAAYEATEESNIINIYCIKPAK